MMGAASAACNFLRKLAWRHQLLTASAVFEFLGFGLFCLSYVALWLLVLVAAFRPVDTFSWQGSLGLRVQNAAFALGALALLHLWLAFAVATAGS
jgi:hypothetical protein